MRVGSTPIKFLVMSVSVSVSMGMGISISIHGGERGENGEDARIL